MSQRRFGSGAACAKPAGPTITVVSATNDANTANTNVLIKPFNLRTGPPFQQVIRLRISTYEYTTGRPDHYRTYSRVKSIN